MLKNNNYNGYYIDATKDWLTYQNVIIYNSSVLLDYIITLQQAQYHQQSSFSLELNLRQCMHVQLYFEIKCLLATVCNYPANSGICSNNLQLVSTILLQILKMILSKAAKFVFNIIQM